MDTDRGRALTESEAATLLYVLLERRGAPVTFTPEEVSKIRLNGYARKRRLNLTSDARTATLTVGVVSDEVVPGELVDSATS